MGLQKTALRASSPSGCMSRDMQPLRRRQEQRPEIRREGINREGQRPVERGCKENQRGNENRLLPIPAAWRRSHGLPGKENISPNPPAPDADCEQQLEACVLCGCILGPDMYRRFKSLRKLSATIRRACAPTPYVYEHIVNMAAAKGSDSPRERAVPFCVACINWIQRLEASVSAAQPAAVFVGVCSCEAKGPPEAASDDEDFLGLWDLSSEDESAGAADNAPVAALAIGSLALQRADRLVLIPLDNLILFLGDPGGSAGGAVQPDRRSMFRLMCALCAAHKQPGSAHAARNPYRMFCTPVADRILRMFERDYAHKFTASAAEADKRGRRRLCVESVSPDESAAMLNDIVRCWWETVGMPPVLPHRANAKLVRKALRLEE